MIKLIQFLVYTFTNRLHKVISFHFTNGVPSKETEKHMRYKLQEQYGPNIALFFDDTESGTKIIETYIKKSQL